MLAQQLPGRVEDFRWKRLAAEGEFRGPSVEQGQVGFECFPAPGIVEDLEAQIGVPRHERGGSSGPAQPHQCGQRPGLISQSATPSFQPRVLHGCEILPSRPIPMRTVAQIPHRAMRIVVQEWNEKYHIQYVWGPLEQTYRFPVEGSGGLEAIQALGARLVPEVEQIFLRMKDARSASLSADSSDKPGS